MSIFESEITVADEYRPLFGRRILTSSVSEEELTAEDIAIILSEVLPNHFRNMQDIQYLQGYLRGNQKILDKVKLVREEINNKVLENNAFHIIEFKKGFVYGNAIQYVQQGSGVTKDEIETLNGFMRDNDKASKDVDLAEDFYNIGTSYRITLPSKNPDKPFDIFNLDPKQAGVVYSTDISHEPLFGFYIVSRQQEGNEYFKLTAYTRNHSYVFKVEHHNNYTEFDVKYEKTDNESHILGDVPIIEYPLNKSRFGLVELVMPTLDSLNKISSNDVDDIEQFVQSLIVLTNAEIDLDTLSEAKQAGAIMLKQTNPQYKPEIVSVVNKLLHSETKILWDRLYNNMLTIAGVPRMSDKVSSGDTGQARLVGEGWTMADERAKQDELYFKISEKKLLKIVLGICKNKSDSGIKTLKPKDIEIKFTRNRSDNMLVKAQTLLNLKTAQIDPEVALRTVELWSDPAEVMRQSANFYGDAFWQAVETQMANQVNPDTKQQGEVTNPSGVNAK